MGHTLKIGALGEELAAEYLLKAGFTIRDRNWSDGRREIDIVAERNGVLHIVEVKCRKRAGLTLPEEAMTVRKFGLLQQAAANYIETHGLDLDVQFDLVAVDHDGGGGHRLRYFPDVMSPRW